MHLAFTNFESSITHRTDRSCQRKAYHDDLPWFTQFFSTFAQVDVCPQVSLLAAFLADAAGSVAYDTSNNWLAGVQYMTWTLKHFLSQVPLF